jgi:hypothetical protein
MAYSAYDTHLTRGAPKTHAAPAGLYAFLGGTMAALAFVGWGFWLIENVVPGAIRGMVLVFGAA